MHAGCACDRLNRAYVSDTRVSFLTESAVNVIFRKDWTFSLDRGVGLKAIRKHSSDKSQSRVVSRQIATLEMMLSVSRVAM